MNLLAVETATDACSAALLSDGVVYERHEITPRQHGRLLPQMVDAVFVQSGLRPTDMDAFAFGRGPGSFTGVRIATAMTQGLAYAVHKPVVPVSSMAALAHASGAQRCATLFDARMGQVYVGLWLTSGDDVSAVAAERLCDPGVLPALPDGEWLGAGVGFAVYQNSLPDSWQSLEPAAGASGLPQASAIAQLAARRFARGETVEPAAAEPLYLRNNVADESARRLNQ